MAGLYDNTGYVAAVSEVGAPPDRDMRQRSSQLVHAAVNQPDTGALDMRNKHQRCRSVKGGRSAVGGVTAKQLPQPRVAEVAAKRLPQGLKRPDRSQVAQSGMAQQARHAWRRRADERRPQHLEDLAGVGAEGTKALCVGAASEAT